MQVFLDYLCHLMCASVPRLFVSLNMCASVPGLFVGNNISEYVPRVLVPINICVNMFQGTVGKLIFVCTFLHH